VVVAAAAAVVAAAAVAAGQEGCSHIEVLVAAVSHLLSLDCCRVTPAAVVVEVVVGALVVLVVADVVPAVDEKEQHWEQQ
jgi:hypothetical protein